jgi:hypothetical protein
MLQGFATSAISGAEGLVRASRSALTQFLNAQLQPQRHEILMIFLQDISTVLNDNLTDDRFAIPAVEFVAFLVDSYIPIIPEDSNSRFAKFLTAAYVSESSAHIFLFSFRSLFTLVQKSHLRSANIARLEAAIKAYGTLVRIGSLRAGILKKLTGMLLHPFPRVCLVLMC